MQLKLKAVHSTLIAENNWIFNVILIFIERYGLTWEFNNIRFKFKIMFLLMKQTSHEYTWCSIIMIMNMIFKFITVTKTFQEIKFENEYLKTVFEKKQYRSHKWILTVHGIELSKTENATYVWILMNVFQPTNNH